MKLSVIIVNYNVKNFLEQCLYAVYKATEGIAAEVFVVDNNSTDDSLIMVREKFPEVIIIANKKNVGFSKANNQAMKVAKGEYILLLNPDTVVEEDAFKKCIDFSDQHPEMGGLGVKMVDGNGIFLPESKRGLPTPAASFYKIFGLSALFPKSTKFSTYHLSYLDNDKTAEIEVLSGAYMWMRKSVLDNIGYLDEAFFMYGEDIDLSYRIIQAGYKNYYFPFTKIIHYKGESTKKGSINYVFVFYNAMIIFAKKHYAAKAKTFSFFINIAIYLRAFLAILKRFISAIKLPLIDVLFILISLVILNAVKPFLGFPNQLDFFDEYGVLNVLNVLLSFLLGIAIAGGYKKDVSVKNTVYGLLLGGTIFLTSNHFLFPEASSFSNKYIVSILVGVLVFIPFSRILLNYLNYLRLKKNKLSTSLIVGNVDFIQRVKNTLKNKEVITIKPSNQLTEEDAAVYQGKLYQLPDLIEIYHANEVIVNTQQLSYAEIIELMDQTKSNFVDFKFLLNSHLLISSQQSEVLE